MFKCRFCSIEFERPTYMKLNEHETIMVCPSCERSTIYKVEENTKKLQQGDWKMINESK